MGRGAVAARLVAAGAAPGAKVAVVLPKGWEQVAAVLGILRAGMCYVPVDPSLPRDRAHALFAIAGALRRAGKGVLEVNSDFGDGDFEILRAAAEAAGRPMSLLLLQVDNAPALWRKALSSRLRTSSLSSVALPSIRLAASPSGGPS